LDFVVFTSPVVLKIQASSGCSAFLSFLRGQVEVSIITWLLSYVLQAPQHLSTGWCRHCVSTRTPTFYFGKGDLLKMEVIFHLHFNNADCHAQGLCSQGDLLTVPPTYRTQEGSGQLANWSKPDQTDHRGLVRNVIGSWYGDKASSTSRGAAELRFKASNECPWAGFARNRWRPHESGALRLQHLSDLEVRSPGRRRTGAASWIRRVRVRRVGGTSVTAE